MRKIEISRYQDFVDSSLLREQIETNQDDWGKYFNDMVSSNKEASSKTGTSSGLPKWAEKQMDLDKLKGKSADERWDWLTKRINTAIKDKQATKIESIKGSEVADFPGYRILWKEDKTETGDAVDSSGKTYKIYYTDIFKGNPGTYIDRKDNNGKPGEEIEKGYWGQKSRVEKVPGSTLPQEGGILWVSPPEGEEESEVTLYDLFASTDIGREVMTWLHGGKEYKEYLKTGKVTSTDSPPTSKEINASFTPEQKKNQEENAQKISDSGQRVKTPNYEELTSREYTYSKDSFNLTWDQIFKALEEAGLADKMNFKRANLVGIRNTPFNKNTFSNRFIDLIVLMGPKKDKQVKIYPATTTPGPAFMYIPFRNWWISAALQETLNPNGPAILQPGVYEFKVGSYKGKYDALIQKGDVRISRFTPVQNLKDLTFKNFSPSPIEKVKSGIDIIKAETNPPSIDSFSAGSQVIKKSSDFKEMMETLRDYGQDTISYALINSSSLENNKKK